MTDQEKSDDSVDQAFFEEIEPEEMILLLEEEKAKLKENNEANKQDKKSHFPRWIYGLIVGVMLLNVIALFPRTISIPAIDFLLTSARLSLNETVQTHKEAVVVIETETGKGTGFGISDDGYIVTNHHVVEGEETVTVNYPDAGLFKGEVISSDGSVDLALIKVMGEDLPYLTLAGQTYDPNDTSVLFIGNPLRFNGIANEGEWIGLSARYALDTDVMLLDAPVYRGNSGSPVINSAGEVIGVIYATTKDDELGKLGLAIPIANLDSILAD